MLDEDTRGDALLSPSVTRRLIGEYASRAKAPKPSHALDQLTDREREVVALVAEGLNNDEIAERLVMSGATAKTHVAHLLTKLDARDRIHLVIIAHRSGLIGR